MSIRRGHVPEVDRFTPVPNDWLRDERLSFKARGLLAYLLSHREGWEISGIRDLVRHTSEGRQAVTAALNELEELGYIERDQGRAERGKYGSVDYLVGNPTAERIEKARSRRSAPVDGKPVPGNPLNGLSNTKKTTSLEDQPQKTTASSSSAQARARAPRPRRAQQPKVSMPEGWAPSDETLDWCHEQRPDVDLRWTFEKYVLHRRENEQRSSNWDEDFKAWVMRERGEDADVIDLTDRRSGAAPKDGPGRPAWCGDCDERTRLWEDSGGTAHRCTYCHPLAAGAI